jgi:hypothetical protein
MHRAIGLDTGVLAFDASDIPGEGGGSHPGKKSDYRRVCIVRVRRRSAYSKARANANYGFLLYPLRDQNLLFPLAR